MTIIINLTQHSATPAQKESGVVDLRGLRKDLLKRRLTFEALPTMEEIRERAADIAALAVHNDLGSEDGEDPFPTHAMVGGAPYLMAPLEGALRDLGVLPVYAFTRRMSKEKTSPDGSVKTEKIFVHEGFVGLEPD